MQSSKRHHRAKRSRWAQCNTPEALRRRRAAYDARREAMAENLAPIPPDPEPLSVWQTITIELLVPIGGRCDQFAVLIDGERAGLMSGTQIGTAVRGRVRKRPSVEAMREARSLC